MEMMFQLLIQADAVSENAEKKALNAKKQVYYAKINVQKVKRQKLMPALEFNIVVA